LRRQSVATQDVEGHIIEVDYIEDNEESYYELYLNGDCITLGEPIHEKPTSVQIHKYVKKYLTNESFFT